MPDPVKCAMGVGPQYTTRCGSVTLKGRHDPPGAVFLIATTMAMVPSVLRCVPVHPGDRQHQLLLTQVHRAHPARPLARVVVGAGGDRHPVLGEHSADRLDPATQPVHAQRRQGTGSCKETTIAVCRRHEYPYSNLEQLGILGLWVGH
jgi:hypothetical protein